MQLVCAGECKSRADKGISSFHGLRLARSTAAARLLLVPRRGGGKENPKNGDQDSSLPLAKANQPLQKHPVPRKAQLGSTKKSLNQARCSSPGGLGGSSPPWTGLGHLFSLRTPLPPSPKASQLPLPLPTPTAPTEGLVGAMEEGKAPAWASLEDLARLPTPPPLGHLQPSRHQQQDSDACEPEKPSGRRGEK